MAQRPRVTGNGSRTATIAEAGTPLIDDQIREYRNTRRAAYEAQRMARQAGNIVGRIVGRQPREHTLSMVVDPNSELSRSLAHRARTVPGEVLYMTQRDSPVNRVYRNRTEERMLVTNGQQDRSFIYPESFEELVAAGFEYIHLGVLQVRLQIMHRTYAGTMALVVFRDTRWTQEGEEDRSIIAAMEADLSQGHQLIYVIPDIMMTIRDFYQHVQISVLTKGYQGFQGEANLLVTRSCRCRLTNVPNVGFAYNIQKVVEYLNSKGVKAIQAQKLSTKKFQGTEWNIKPSNVVVPMQPTSMITRVNYDSSRSLRFGDYQASTSSAPPKYNDDGDSDDEIQKTVEHVNMLYILDEAEDEYPALAAEEEIFPLENMVGEEAIISQFLESLNLSDDDDEDSRSQHVMNLDEEEFPKMKEIERVLASVSESAISSFRPPEVEMGGIAPAYAPATSTTGWAGTTEFPFTTARRPRVWDSNNEFYMLPPAQSRQGAIFVMPLDFDVKVFERWESITLLHLAERSFDNADDKMRYIENLLGEDEKKHFVEWRMKYTVEYETMKAQALGDQGTQNIINQIRLIFFLENPQVGTTTSQDAAYKTLKSLVCTEMTDTAIYRYMNDYFHLSAKTGRAWASEELSKEFFTKLPRGLGDAVEKAFKEKHPSNTVGIAARITFTKRYLKELCEKVALQKSIGKMDFCRNTPVHGLYGREKSYRKYGARKSTSYKGKPHKSHVRIGKKKHLALRKKNCRCYACGEEGHFASECRNPRKIMDRVKVLDSLELEDGLDVVSVGFDEDDVSDIYSIDEEADNYKFTNEEMEDFKNYEVYMMNFEEIEEPNDYLVGEPSDWRSKMKVSRRQYFCKHEWSFEEAHVTTCKACGSEAVPKHRVDCKKCEMTVCLMCQPWYYKNINTEEVKKTRVRIERVIDWKDIALKQHEVLKTSIAKEKQLSEEVEFLRKQNEELKGKEPIVFEEDTEETAQLVQKLEDMEKENELMKILISKKEAEEVQYLNKITELNERIRRLEQQQKYREEEQVNALEEVSVNALRPRNNHLNIKCEVEVKERKVTLNAILDTGATVCVADERMIPSSMREQAKNRIIIRGVNGVTEVNEVTSAGKLWVGKQWFYLPQTYIMPTLADGVHMIIGMNFIRTVGLRIENGEVTIYKIMTTVQAPPIVHELNYIEELDLELQEYYDICSAETSKGEIAEEFISPNLIQRMKKLGYIGEEPLKHWEKNQVKCRIEVKNPDMIIEDKPLKHVTPAMKETMAKHVKKLLELKVIRPSQSKHRTTAIIVQSGTEIDPVTGKEKRGKERLVFNYKRLNDNTEKDQYSLPGINTIIRRIGNAKIYSKFDLKSGFHQVAMDPESIPWTAFWAIDGLYEWLVMPFGLKNAPAVFQRKMDNCFRGTEEFIAIYIDDILVFSETVQQHKEHLKKFMEICEKNGLVLSPTKMKIGTRQVDFLGATIGNSKIKLQPHIIQKIIDMKDEELKEVKGLRKWLGILNYARSYIPKLGKILGPLYSKTSPNGERRMNSQDWKIVKEVKEIVADLPDLELPPEKAIMIIETDGCMEGWGGVCKWKDNSSQPRWSEKICAYASGKFTPIKSTIDAEIQAVINSLDKFKIYYLDKKELVIRTDSQAIVSFYKKSSDHKPSRVRWLAFTDYITGTGLEVKFEHIDGKDNVLADTLSRLVKIIFHQEKHQSEDILINAVEETLRKGDANTRQKINDLVKRYESWMNTGFNHHVNVLTIKEEPVFKCGCNKPAQLKTSRTSRNPNRQFYSCETKSCFTWVWKDQIDTFVQEKLVWEKEIREAIRCEDEEWQEPAIDPGDPGDTIDGAFDLLDVSNDDQWRRS
nr:polyprotein [Sugarcane bacilliform virus]